MSDYNPFKMLGSYIGVIVGGIAGYYLGRLAYFGIAIACDSCPKEELLKLASIYFIVPTILGFLVGWGIHSLIRKLT